MNLILAKLAQVHRFTDGVLLLHFDGGNGSTTITDEAGNAWSTVGAASQSSDHVKFGASSLYVNQGYVVASDPTVGNLKDSDFTMESWVYTTKTFDSNYRGIFGKRSTSVFNAGYTLGTWSSYGLMFQWSTTGTDSPGATWPLALPVNEWHHVALCRDTGELRLYVDGSLQAGTGTSIGNTLIYDSTQSLMIGHMSSNVGGDVSSWRGYIDEARLTIGVARYTSNFTPPAAPFPNS